MLLSTGKGYAAERNIRKKRVTARLIELPAAELPASGLKGPAETACCRNLSLCLWHPCRTWKESSTDIPRIQAFSFRPTGQENAGRFFPAFPIWDPGLPGNPFLSILRTESFEKREQTRFHLVIPEEWDKYIFRAIRPSGRNFPPGAVFIQGTFHGRSTKHAIRRTGRRRPADAEGQGRGRLRHGNADPQTPAFRVRHGGPHAEQRSGSGRHCPAGIHPRMARSEELRTFRPFHHLDVHDSP